MREKLGERKEYERAEKTNTWKHDCHETGQGAAQNVLWRVTTRIRAAACAPAQVGGGDTCDERRRHTVRIEAIELVPQLVLG